MVIWDAFKGLLFTMLQLFHGAVGDWGVAIIVLTVVIRLALMPLTIKQTKSMYELQRIQPKIKELQEKYKNDKEKQQEELMKFYSENKVNPFGGCLPMLVQMPFFIALYQVIGGTPKKPGLLLKFLEALPAAEQAKAVKFLFVLPDISSTPQAMFTSQGVLAALPYLVLVILFGISVWLPQWITPGEKSQKMMGAYMGVMFLYFGWVAPAGVLLYWVTSSAWGIAQQLITMRMMASHDPAADVAAAVDKKKSAAASGAEGRDAGDGGSSADGPSPAKTKKKRK